MRPLIFLLFLTLFALRYDAQTTEPLEVQARAGDTVESVAKRYGADPEAVAKFNGLLPHTVLGSGRTIKIVWGSDHTAVPCYVQTSELPAIRGLKLRMAKKDLAALLKPIGVNALGITKNVYPSSFLDRSELEGVLWFEVEFYEDKLSRLVVLYDHVEWKSDTEFARSVGKHLGLPADGWARSAIDLRMDCKGFSIAARANEIKLVDLEAEKMKKDREAAEAERKRKTFKP